jgi:GTP cyclohydrolase I
MSLETPRTCDNAQLEEIVNNMLKLLGEDSSRQGLQRTPKRVAASLKYLTKGYRQNLNTVLNGAIFDEPYSEMVIVKDIEIFSLCEHHMLPFYGKAHVAYIPNGKIIGLSKIPRVVDIFARRLQVQERLTMQIAESLMDALKPCGVGVVIEAFHLCMAMRGVEKSHSLTMTSTMLGSFRESDRVRSEFLSLINRKSSAV